MTRRHATLFFIALLAPCAALAGVGDVHPTQIPGGLTALGDTLSLRWAEPLDCQLELGPTPENLLPLDGAAGGPGALDFVPDSLGLTPGAWTARLVSLVNAADTSLPFPLFIEADQAPLMLSPANGDTVPGGGVTLRWEPVLGVPYYHVLFSDQEILIEEDENGDPVIAGAAIVWQAITPSTSIAYGDVDPSGFFTGMNGNAAPLVPGPTYNWLVLNNYGNNPALSSTRQAGVSAFNVDGGSALDAPVLLAPAEGDTLQSDSVVFNWSAVDGASHYQFALSRIVDEDGNEGAVGVFDQVTGQTSLELPASSLLVDSRYRWKVYALDESGQGTASAPREFVYVVASGRLKIRTRDDNGDVLAYVQVLLTPLGGGGSALPVVTGSSGGWDDDLSPGAYRLEASFDGHEDASAQAEVIEDSLRTVTLVLPPSPATLAGTVRDLQSQPVAYAVVSARDTLTGELRQVDAGGGGGFQLGVTPGVWRLKATRSGYHAADSLLVTAQPGAYQTLPAPLHVEPNSCTLAGAALNASGAPVVSATVTLARDGESLQAFTGSDGQFQFNLDAGLWTLTAAKPGYVSPAPRTLSFAPGQDLALDPPLTLSAQAAILNGFVQAGGGMVGGATVTATPSAGYPQTALSGSQGAWQLSLAPGTWTLRASKAGYSPGPPLQLTLAPGGGQSGLVLTLSPNPCSVSGQVSDGAAPLAGATVTGGGASAGSLWDGSYTLTLPAGTQLLQASKTGYSGAQQTLELAPGQQLTGVDFVLAPGAATVSGQVLSEGLPVAGATVWLRGDTDSLAQLSGPSGGFSLSAPPGAYLLGATKAAMLGDGPVALTLAPGQSLPGQLLTLTPAGARLSGTVTADGAPLPAAQLRAVSALGEASTGCDPSGGWSLLLDGGADWTVTASRSGYGSVSAATGVLADGATWQHDFALTPQPAQLSGRVRDDEGLDVAGALLRLDAGADSLTVATDGSGRYAISLAPGDWTLSLAPAGFAPYSAVLTLPVGSTVHNPVLETRFARLDGTVADADGAPLGGVTLTVSGAASGSALSGADGAFHFPRLLAGASTLKAQKSGFAVAQEPLLLAEDETAALDLVLTAHTGTLSGAVRGDGDSPLAGASVQLRAGGQLVAQALTDGDGLFAVSGLDLAQALSVSASLAGHSAVSTNPLLNVLPPAAGLLFQLAPDDGVIRGRLTDADSGVPVAGALVIVDDGAGYHGEALSDAAGDFVAAGLRRASVYSLVADAAGWAPLALDAVSPDGAPLALALTSAPASIYGTLYGGREPGSPLPAGSRLRGVAGSGGVDVSVAVDALGAYSLGALPPGSYTLVLRADGYLSEPRQQIVQVGEGQAAGPYDFELVETSLASLEISGVDELDNDGSAIFRGAQLSADGEQLDYPLAWTVEPANAGTLDAATGRFTPRADFLGTVTLGARHLASGLSATRALSVTARVSPDSARVLDDGNGVSISLPAGALAQTTRLSMRRRTPGPLRRRAGSFRVEGELYRFLPDGLAFGVDTPATLTLPIPNPLFNQRLAMGWWDAEALRWEAMLANKGSAGLSRSLAHFSEYALLVANTPLGVADAAFSANPFSPALGPVQLSFVLSSQAMAAPLVDLTVYNLLGDPVRTLLRHEALEVGVAQVVAWDGLTDAGELARNGRYLLRLVVDDGRDRAERILQLVLIK